MPDRGRWNLPVDRSSNSRQITVNKAEIPLFRIRSAFVVNLTVHGKKTWWWACGLCFGLLNAPVFTANAATLSTLFAFDLHQTSAGVVEGDGSNAGFLFGTTNDTSLTYGGSIFRVPVAGGAPTIIYQLQTTDGYSPQATLLRGVDHLLYGTTNYWPRISNSTNIGYGTIFRVAQDGTGFTTLHVFSGADGVSPNLALIEDANYLYGAALSGGINGTGTVYRVRKADGLLEVLHQFAAVDSLTGVSTQIVGGLGEGAVPSSSLTLASDGRLYGVTRAGGAYLKTTTNGTTGAGTIYSLNIDGTGFQTLYNFSALDETAVSPTDSTAILSFNADGAQPTGNLLEVSSGVLVGTTSDGGDPRSSTVSGHGTVFQFDIASRTLTTLHAFDNDTGAAPSGALVKDAASGLVYGVAVSGSTTSTTITAYGSIYHVNPTTGDFAIDHAMTFAEGSGLTAGLMQASNGDLFGTTTSGNACTAVNGSGYGAVYRYSLATGASSSGYSSCTAYTATSGGGAIGWGFLCCLSALGLAPPMRRRVFGYTGITR
jgi:uncharacterized repeat protein (TIGR03803 family)